MPAFESSEVTPDEAAQGRRLSYKFQRLRERIREAIGTGELAGKLPGERVLARRFKVNAKTLSKALTDLAAEGLLERNIGLGTFVRDSNPTRTTHKCLVLHDPDESDAMLARLGCEDFEVHTHDNVDDLPPSLLNPHRSIIVLSKRIKDDVLRDLVVRGKNVVLIDRLLTPYATHAVMVDRAGAAAEMARRLINAGHRSIMIVDNHQPSPLFAEVRTLISGAGHQLATGTLDDVRHHVEHGVTALICASAETARHATEYCTTLGNNGHIAVSITAVGRLLDEAPCTGQFVPLQQIADATKHLLREATPHRPITLWLSGTFIDRFTVSPV
jgi:hypothetical protein